MTGSFLILGAEHWHAPWHLHALEKAGGRLAAVSDASADVGARLRDGRDIPYYRDPREALAQFPDAVPIVLTRPDETPALLDVIIDEARPFILEKPGTVDARVLDPIAERARVAGVRTAVPFVNRFADFWRELESLGGRAGEWTHAHFRILAGPPDRYLRDGVPWVLRTDSFGGGCLRNLGIHAADAIAQLTDPAELNIDSAATFRNRTDIEVEDFAIATLRTADGRSITLEAGYAMPAENAADKEWRVHGAGWAVSESNGTVTVRDENGPRRCTGAPSSEQYLAFGRTMVAFAAGEPSDAGTLDDLLRAQRIIDRLYSAARQHHSTG